MQCVSRRILLPNRLSLASDSEIVSLPQSRLSRSLAAVIRRTVERHPLAEGIYRDASFPDMPLRRLAKVLLDSSDSALDQVLLARNIFHLEGKDPKFHLSLRYRPHDSRIVSDVRNAGELYQESLTTDGRRTSVTLTAAEEVYLILISLLRRISVNAYPAYLVDETEKNFQLAVFIRDLDRVCPLSFMCLHDSDIEFQTVDILGDVAMKAIMYAVAAENVLKSLLELLSREELPIDIIEIVGKMTRRTSELTSLALKIDPNCIKAYQTIHNLEALKRAAHELNRDRISSHGSTLSITIGGAEERTLRDKGETLH